MITDDGKFRDYLCSYGYDGAQWSFLISATSPEDARARMEAIGAWGRVDGQHMLTVSAGLGSWVPFLVWLRNRFARGAT